LKIAFFGIKNGFLFAHLCFDRVEVRDVSLDQIFDGEETGNVGVGVVHSRVYSISFSA